MKVSGARTETISSYFQNGMLINEEVTIQTVTSELAKEGKHVINIIHGTQAQLMGEGRQTLTFLWEADDTDPVYIKAVEKERIAHEKEMELQRQKERERLHKKFADIDIKNYNKKIEELEDRIYQATAKPETMKSAYWKETKRFIKYLFIALMELLFIVLLFIGASRVKYSEVFAGSGMQFCLVGMGICLIFLFPFQVILIPADFSIKKEEIRKNVEERNQKRAEDKNNLPALKKELAQYKNELAKINRTH